MEIGGRSATQLQVEIQHNAGVHQAAVAPDDADRLPGASSHDRVDIDREPRFQSRFAVHVVFDDQNSNHHCHPVASVFVELTQNGADQSGQSAGLGMVPDSVGFQA